MSPFRTLFSRLMHNPLIKDNTILFVGSFIAGILGFLYHFFMARSLGPADYGILGTILSGFYMVNVAFVNTIQTAISRFAVQFHTHKQQSKLASLLFHSSKKLLLYTFIAYIAYALLTPLLSRFFTISIPLLLFSGLLAFPVVLIPVARGILQGTQSFTALSINVFVEGAAKFLSGALLVYLGFKVFGAIAAILIAYLITLLFFYKPLHHLFFLHKEPFATKEVYTYTLPVLLMLLSLTAFFSVDVLLVKHFFSPEDAGFYSALSLLGKVIFFGSLSISQVMFPKVSELADKGEKTHPLFLKSLGILVFCLAVAIIVFFSFPQLLVSLLFGDAFLSIIPLVGPFALFIAAYSLVYFTCFYSISLKKTFFIYILIFFNILQIALIWIYHVHLNQIVYLLILLMTILFVALVLLELLIKPSRSKILLPVQQTLK